MLKGSSSNKSLNHKLFILILSLFLLDTLFLNFFHTEKTLTVDKNCPADNFQVSTISDGQVNLFFIPGLFFLFFIYSLSWLAPYFWVTHRRVSRSPPLV
jgi:hypothetical protein